MTIDESALADRLYADALAMDLRVPTAFMRASTTVSADRVEQYIRQRAEGYREEHSAAQAAVERAVVEALSRWRESSAEPALPRIITIVTRAAKNLLQDQGRELILRVDRQAPGREVLRWRFISLVLPPSVLIAAKTTRGVPSSTTVRLLHSSIAPDSAVAQHHVHHAAMMSFEHLWASLRLRALLRPGELIASLQDERALCPGLHSGVCPGGRAHTPLPYREVLARATHMAEWADVIRQAFIARRVLDCHARHTGPLSDCRDPVCAEVGRSLRAFRAGRISTQSRTGTPYPWFDERVRLERRFMNAVAPSIPGRVNIRRHRFLEDLTSEERDVLARGFLHLRSPREGTEDPWYESLFVQYLRIKTAVFGLLVHPPGEPGLRNFVRHFQQIKVYAPDSGLLRPMPADEPGLRVSAVERRIAPDAWPESAERWDRENGRPSRSTGSPASTAPQRPQPEMAWLIHFQRKGSISGLPLYGAAVRQMEGDADKIVRALSTEPLRLRTLRGIDICGVEEAQPLWVSAQTLRRTRDQSRTIAASRPRFKLQPLGLTLHCGEDFRWLTSGVRAIAEPFRWNLIERGDRIGHGIAITLDPEDWWARRDGHVVPTTRFDRLLDLAFLAEYADDRSQQQDDWLRVEISRAITEMRFEPHAPSSVLSTFDVVETAKALWRDLGGAATRTLMTTPTFHGDDSRRHERWIHSYLWNLSAQTRGDSIIRLKVDDDRDGLRITTDRNERDLLVKARARVIRDMARWQVCIESNPSSNLVVGGVEAVGTAQDFLQQRPTRDAGLTLTWTISTDDPITFSTTLADEYAYAWAGMVLRRDNPYDPSYARALLDEAAATSLRMRFTTRRDDQDSTRDAKPQRHGDTRY